MKNSFHLPIVALLMSCFISCKNDKEKIELALSKMNIKLADDYKLDSISTNSLGENMYAYLTITARDKQFIIKALKKQTTFKVLDSTTLSKRNTEDEKITGGIYKKQYLFKFNQFNSNGSHGATYSLFLDTVTNKVNVNYFDF